MVRALAECAPHAGAGSGASHLITGHGAEHARLEEELAAFTQRERALLFSTGYMANLAVITALAGRGERVLLDRLCHASLIDGARLSGATLMRYPHAAAAEAARIVEADPGGDRHAVPLVEADMGDLIAEFEQRKRGELAIGAFGLLHGQHVDVGSRKPIGDAVQPGANRIHVPGGQPHG